MFGTLQNADDLWRGGGGDGGAQKELNMLASLIGHAPKPADNFKINLFPDANDRYRCTSRRCRVNLCEMLSLPKPYPIDNLDLRHALTTGLQLLQQLVLV